jgi:hypothetical protein
MTTFTVVPFPSERISKPPPKSRDAFSHASESRPRQSKRGNRRQRLGRNSSSSVSNFYARPPANWHMRISAAGLVEWRWMFVRHSCTTRKTAVSSSAGCRSKSEGICRWTLMPLLSSARKGADFLRRKSTPFSLQFAVRDRRRHEFKDRQFHDQCSLPGYRTATKRQSGVRHGNRTLDMFFFAQTVYRQCS